MKVTALLAAVCVSAVMSSVAWATEFCVGDQVVTDSHAHGTIVAVYPDQTVDIDFGSSTYNWSINKISPIPSSIDGYRVGDKVVTESHAHGRIIAVYPDHTVDIDFGSTSYNWKTSKISRVYSSIDGFEIGDAVVTDSHAHGTIVAVYDDHSVDIDFGPTTYNWKTSKISLIPSSIDGYRVGDVVVTESHARGTIVAVYPDQSVDIDFGSTTYNWKTSKISRVSYCTGRDTCRH
jgi:preprotein translocase subunit YajC